MCARSHGRPQSFGTTEQVMDATTPQTFVFTAEQAAKVLLLDQDRSIELAVRALYRLVEAKKIRPVIVGKWRRFTPAELTRYLNDETERYDDLR